MGFLHDSGRFLLLLVSIYLVRSSLSSSHRIKMTKQLLLVGGYSDEIHLLALDKHHLHSIASFPSGTNPTFLATLGNVLYAVNEVESGALEAFSFSPHHTSLTRLGHPASTCGADPAAISVHSSGKWVLFANYNGGSYGVLQVDHSRHQGVHQQPVSLIKVPGLTEPSNNPRQEAPHPHQIITDSSGKFVFVCDLGTDKIHTRVLNVSTGKLDEAAAPEVSLEPGSGPRHLIFSRDERFAYVINELANSVSQLSYDPGNGALRLIQSWSTLDDSVANKSACTAAEVALSPDGRYLYASNRGNAEDTIAVFGVDAEGDGGLTFLGLDRVGGSGPRHFAFDRSGEMVVVGLQNSNKLNVLSRNVETGRLSVVFSLDGVQAPSFIQFM
ncbi:uncharacterized protein LOC112350430 [Selaginella moellendorffii]|uniref:uncharacterized protein LOC112350430 n=1 Tax=Selaginella moellendorffii TaxID=88036 RepID=UPI000D1CC185|nr:uncharacterized protein LOC112350430 [Selaginella moellendorffii]|eukprot:XP_024542384.1 uncharacterized protein LOC112350430 [Selaginella moellendorffii]